MVSTPDQAAFFIDMKNWPEDMAEWENNSICGLVVRGAVQQKHVDEFMRLLPPGGHLMLIAPDEQPTGHTGAILVEDSGFEIRDAILWVRGPGRLHYVAKAARKEREAGCQHLKGKAGHEAVERKEGSAGVENPRAGAGRTAKHVKNFHPTVKPIGLMVRLLAGVPKDRGPVLDLFMGSGTTGIGCSMTGHDFFGIERGPEYLEIGDARIRHWDRAHVGWQAATIISDHEVEAEVVKPLTLDDLFD
jgi:DNA modification methylase